MLTTFYCDESGYTGTDWADPDQRVFVHGGWLVVGSKKDELIAGIDELRGRHRLQGKELKWRQLTRRKAPESIFRDFFELMLTHGSLPFFVVADKDYITAGKAIETYFDPAYNHNLPMAFTSDAKTKKSLAECLLSAPMLLRSFARLLHKGKDVTAEEIRQIGSDMADHFSHVGVPSAAATLQDFTEAEIDDIQREFAVDPWARTTTAHTLWRVVQLLEEFVRDRDLHLEIVHDNVVRFDELLELVRGLFRPDSGTDPILINGQPIYTSMPTTRSLDLADSKEEPLIQAADLLCGYLRVLFTKLKDGRDLSEDDESLAQNLAVIHDMFSTWDTNVPETMFAAFANAAFGRYAPES